MLAIIIIVSQWKIILNPGIKLVCTLYLILTWIWRCTPQRSTFELMGLKFHSVFSSQRLHGGREAGRVLLWSSLLFFEMKEALNSDNGVGHVWFWLLINISFYILNLYRPQNHWRWKRIQYEAIPLQACFLKHSCSHFVQLRVKHLGSRPLTATSQL